MQRVKSAQVGESFRKLTFEEYLSLDDEAAQAEWVNGEVQIYMPASVRHQQLINFLDRVLGLFVELLGLGLVLTDRIAMRALPHGPAREPDLLFISTEHRDRLTAKYLAGPADLVVELISDESVERDRVVKFYEYQASGVREYLIIDPRIGKERIDWYVLDTQGKYQPIVADGEGKYRSVIVPGFWLRDEWLFRERLPEPLRILQEIAPDAVRRALNSD